MCDKCDELDKKIEHYRSIAARILDQPTIEQIEKLIDAAIAKKSELHTKE
jgi:hypothetical protein